MMTYDYRKKLDAYMEIGYSEKAASFIESNQNYGKLDDQDIYCEYQSDCGDILILYIDLENELIVDAKFEYIGCTGLQVAASALTEMIKKSTIEQAKSITFNDLITYLESVPKSKHECLDLAITTLRKGINQYLTDRSRRMKRKLK